MGEFARAIIITVAIAAIVVSLAIAYIDGKKAVHLYKANQYSVMKQITGN